MHRRKRRSHLDITFQLFSTVNLEFPTGIFLSLFFFLSFPHPSPFPVVFLLYLTALLLQGRGASVNIENTAFPFRAYREHYEPLCRAHGERSRIIGRRSANRHNQGLITRWNCSKAARYSLAAANRRVGGPGSSVVRVGTRKNGRAGNHARWFIGCRAIC